MKQSLMDEQFMKLALKEAKKGLGKTSPNPCVGAVVVRKGEIVGRGYHRRAGTAHAEVNALESAGASTGGATIYVTLEPCNHFGRTPPCTELILKSGITRVVVGMADPNPHVEGSGSDHLEKSGVTVTRNILEKECRELNRPFIKHITSGLPWVHMKAGISLDGRIAGSRKGGVITNQRSRHLVHLLRDRTDAILVGINTALVDDPSLTTRLGQRSGKDPLRVVLDTDLRLPPTVQMLRQESKTETWVFCKPNPNSRSRSELEKAGAKILPVPLDGDGRIKLRAVLGELGKAGLTSVLVEGGGIVHGTFLRERLVDEASFFIAPLFLGAEGVPVIDNLNITEPSQGIMLKDVSFRRADDNIMVNGFLA